MGEDKDLLQEESNQENVTLDNENENTTKTVKETLSYDYNSATRESMVKRLTTLIDTQSPLSIKSEVETLKSMFYLKLSKEVAEIKVSYLKNEGEEEDFKAPQDELEPILKTELNRYRKLKNDLYAKQEKEREGNLKLKEELIEELKHLVEKEESIKVTFETFHSIQEKWRTIGSVPVSHTNDLWQNYHLHVENFYDYVKINKDLRDLDFKRNQERKEVLCEKAEKLNDQKSAIEAFKTLQIYHQEWKETGPVGKELREPLWERFKAATSVINKRHQAHFTELKEKQLDNLKKKVELCEKVEAIAESSKAKAKDWNQNVKMVQELQEEWRTVGPVPKQDNSPVYRRFRKGCDVFFKNKRDFYKQHKDEQMLNFDQKKALLEKAISLKESEDWKDTSEALITLQKEWKDIGPIPRKYSEKIWSEFRATCDAFFERKKTFYGGSDDRQKENLQLKEAVTEKIKAFVPSGSASDDIKALLQFKEEWLAIGHVPFKTKNQITSDYHNELNAQFDKLNLKEEDREIEKFRSKLDDINDNSGDKLYAERKKLALRLKELESEINTWENNIGFLSKSKSSEALVKEYTVRIDKAKKQTLQLKRKIRMIDSIS